MVRGTSTICTTGTDTAEYQRGALGFRHGANEPDAGIEARYNGGIEADLIGVGSQFK